MQQRIIDDIIAIAGRHIHEYPEASRAIAEFANSKMVGPRDSKLSWIKWYRQLTGASLKEAKEKADIEFAP